MPLYDPEERPSTVLSWDRGVTVADEAELLALRDLLRRCWRAPVARGPA